ncbi:hypothetical protein NKH71_30935 [Mesorhizobium sp. M0983]|uniref:hypothetical protein n=1 Tax=Mesorhizobium sp. M0983 TaxID=2957040 RepID=UPI00333A8761
MGIPESVKKAAEQASGIARPRKQELAELVKVKKPLEFRFKDDGLVPNHPCWPFMIYCGAVKPMEQFDSAAVLEELPRPMVGVTAGGTASTTTFITIRADMRCLELRAEPAGFRALETIRKIGRPRKDPVYGSKAPLLSVWKNEP